MLLNAFRIFVSIETIIANILIFSHASPAKNKNAEARADSSPDPSPPRGLVHHSASLAPD
ncbi:hypothetical protein A2906_01290 [Candidatus Nomurabacteria bacterium RIFCSPLOWO2_01_FULL_37_25]|nr:MAG: hypothetical protein A2906_01290 [Candidatus Nomurabacteria bacterium RIFCSPLOWO2_01_FULL_37_25]